MMRSGLRRSLLAVTLGLGVMAGLARGGEPELGPSPRPVTSGVVGESAAPPMMEGRCDSGANGRRPLRKALRVSCVCTAKTVGHFLKAAAVTCYGNFNDYSCGSIHSETVFVFGSCRDFFGERCLREKPQVPVPVPGYPPLGPPPYAPGGPGTNGAGGCGCP